MTPTGAGRPSPAEAQPDTQASINARPITQETRPLRRIGRTSGLGLGLTQVPDAPEIDPRDAVLADPVLPEDRRRCSWCGGRVGASRFGRPGRSRGYCTRCGTRFNFDPQLLAGNVLAGQYEVVGCLAHGGQGWVYLAIDRHVQNRWVAVKGLLNVEDKGGVDGVRAELGFLARVAHPAIVKIYNFISDHDGNFIVMEYIGGRSLKQSIGHRGPGENRSYAGDVEQPDSALMPVDHALAYMIEVLSALQYLHDLRLIYCDLKPDNIIHSGSYVRLIDLGAVRAAGDATSAILGTHGFQAPEIPTSVPSVASDVYTVGRTLVLLTCDLPDFAYTSGVPDQDAADALSRFDSFYRLLAKACHVEPEERFASADEMRAQTLGVLREVVASAPPTTAEAGGGRRDPAAAGMDPGVADGLWAAGSASVSVSFTAPPPVTPAGSWLELPMPLLDRDDLGAPLINAVAADDPQTRLARLAVTADSSLDVLLECVRAAIELEDAEQAARYLRLAEDHGVDGPDLYRLEWWCGLAAAVDGRIEEASRQFQLAYWQVPGELAPKLALGYARELLGEPDEAEALYRICLRTDTAYIPSAAFGLARVRRAAGDLRGALAVLDLVPASSSAYLLARQQVTHLLLAGATDLTDVQAALQTAGSAGFAAHERAVVQVRAMRRGLDLLLAGAAADGIDVDGRPADEASLRTGLERALHDLARLTPERVIRYALVDEANRVRPWTTT